MATETDESTGYGAANPVEAFTFIEDSRKKNVKASPIEKVINLI
jgi:hypothetical protein